MLAFLGGIGIWELLIIVLIVALLFGARKIPALARALGQSLAEFKKGRHEGVSAPPTIGGRKNMQNKEAESKTTVARREKQAVDHNRNGKKKWKKPSFEDVSGRVMAQPYIRFT